MLREMSLDYRACNHIARLEPAPPSRWKLYFILVCIGLAATLLVYTITTMFYETVYRLRYIENEMQSISIDVVQLNQMMFSVPKEYRPTADDIERSLHRTKEVVTKAVQTKMTDLELKLTNTNDDLQQLHQTIMYLQNDLRQKEKTMKLANVNLINYALESMGATIDSIGATTQLASVHNPPRMLMQPIRSAGDCFGFLGQKGEVVIRLHRPVRVQAVSIDHISASMSPNGTLQTAPREFSVYGMIRHQNGPAHYFGTFQYDRQRQGLQLFSFAKEQQTNLSFELVQFRFLSNNGHAEFTCVYQTGVHGKVEDLLN